MSGLCSNIFTNCKREDIFRDHGSITYCLVISQLSANHINGRCHMHSVLVNTRKHDKWYFIFSNIKRVYLTFVCASSMSSSCIFCRSLSFACLECNSAEAKPGSVNLSSYRFAGYDHQNTTDSSDFELERCMSPAQILQVLSIYIHSECNCFRQLFCFISSMVFLCCIKRRDKKDNT